MASNDTDRTALIVGASRGLGLGMVTELSHRGWRVIGTVRTAERTALHDLAEASDGRVTVEQLDITDTADLPRLHDRLAPLAPLDLLFVNAGTTAAADTPIGDVSTEDFVNVMVTNALGPMRVIEALDDLVSDDGLIGAMSSGQGSITNNEQGSRELYRASKAALNMSMRSYVARQGDSRRSHVLLAPGWIRTALGGDDAPYSLDESIPLLVDVLTSRIGSPGVAYLDRTGAAVPW